MLQPVEGTCASPCMLIQMEMHIRIRRVSSHASTCDCKLLSLDKNALPDIELEVALKNLLVIS